MTARRAKIQIKPKIVPGISKRDSNRNGTNKTSNEIPGEHSTLQESSSGPSDTDKQSNTKPIQQQSAFSLRPKTGLRGSVAPRLHGSMDSMKHIPTAAPGNVPSDPNSEAAVSVATDQCSNSDTTPSTVVAADQSINATPGNQVAELSTPVVAPVKDSEKQPDETIKGTLTANILEAENAENSSQVSSSVKEVEKSPLTTENTPKPAAKPVISRRSRFSVQPKIRTKVPNLSGISSSPSKPATPSVLESQHVSSEVQKASPATKNDEPKLQSKSVSENNDMTELVGEGIAQETRIDLSKPNTDAVEKIEKSVSNDKTLSSSDKPAVGATADGKSLANSGKTANDVVSDNKTLPVSGKTLSTASPEDKDLGSSETANDVTTDGTNLPASGNTVTVSTSDDKNIPSSGKTVADTTSDSKAPLSNDKPTTDAASGGTTLPSSGKPVTDETSNDKTLSNSNKPTTITPQKVISRRSRFALQPKIGARPGNRPFCTSSPQVKPTVRFQDLERKQQLPEHLQKLSEEKTIGLSTVVVFQDGKECEVIDPTPLSAEPESSPSPKSATSEICSSSQVESLSPSVESGDVTDSSSLSEKNKPIPQIKSSDEIAAAATNVSKSQELETKSPVSRRSKFQVRPKLGITKRPENTTEECANQETQKSTKILKPTISKLPLTKAVKNLGTANSFTKLVNSEPDGSSTDHTPPKVPRIMKDDSHVDNTKQKDYPVTLPKTVTKSRKTLPLREKQKKPDLSEHPADKPPDRSKMKMRDLIYWNPISSPMKSPEKKTTRTIRIGEEVPPKVPETQSNENEPFAVPQVKIGADGNIVINEESLVISNTQPSAPICSETVDETDIYSNYGSFRKYTPKSKWSLKETKKFFLALSTVGTDFSMMSNLFPNKTRRDLKNKFKREERKNRWLIDKAIKQQLHFDEHLFEDKSESEDEADEEEASAKKTKAAKIKKNNKTAAANTSKKKQKKVCKKDFIIESEAGSSPPQEVVMEEAVQDDIIIIPEQEPYVSSTGNATGKKPNNVVQRAQQKNVGNNQTNAEEEVVGILMELGRSGSVSTGEENATTSVVDSSKTCPSTITVGTPGSTGAVGGKEVAATNQNATPSLLDNSADVVKDSSSLARTFLQQMGLNKHINTLQDEIVSITEAEISNDNGTQKVILVEVRPKNQKQTVVHMYLVSPTIAPKTDAGQNSSAGNPTNVNPGVPQMSVPALVTTTTLPPPPPPTSTLETAALPPPLVQRPVTTTLPPAPAQMLATTLPPPAATQVTSMLPLPPTQTQVTTTLPPPPPAQTQVTSLLLLPPGQTPVTSTIPTPSTSTLVTATLPPPPPAQKQATCMLPLPPGQTPVTSTIPTPSTSTLVTATLPPPPPPPAQTQVTSLLPLPPGQTPVTSTIPTPSTSTLVTATLPPPPPPAQKQATCMLPLPPGQTPVTSTIPTPSMSTLVTATLPPTVPTVVTSTLTTPPPVPIPITPLLPTQTEVAAATTTTTSSTVVTTNVTAETASATVFAPSR
ncbi:flocculation protein FLO11 [Octopus sinensis]|uniref:Flocculation protein FLO11 n=1 Tax=Octopus sinensis TaxID=2607531 RepID=A0A6P7SYX6_9MOLL|nr:flocculation protein FLO11 [Octopus sinensis]XP_036363054.1 flocculation protein FLO11 [Octopus sinensis]